MAKDESTTTELVFITLPFMGHLLPMVELAKRLVAARDHMISATIVIIKYPYPNDKIDTYIDSLETHHRVSILQQPPLTTLDPNIKNFMFLYVDACKAAVKQTLVDRYNQPASTSSVKLGGLVLDWFCNSLIDVGDDFGVPSYIFFTNGAGFLSLILHFERLHRLSNINPATSFGGETDDEKTTVIDVAGFENPIHMKVWPALLLDKDSSDTTLRLAGNFRRAKGFLVNTFTELEPSILHSLSSSSMSTDQLTPTIFPVGPIINTAVKDDHDNSSTVEVTKWLDSQPPSSVVFLCFGSMGCFNEEQVKEIAIGLERSGQRFLWSLRSPPSASSRMPGEYDDFKEVLPEGFLDRTVDSGRVIGWAPQVAVLEHRAVGAFVSHCGWNSTLESLWFGVPMLTWPIYAEQQLNAFLLVKEVGLGVEIRMDYNWIFNMMVTAKEVEMAIRRMMEDEDGEKVRRKVKEISGAARKTIVSSGDGDDHESSSWESMGRFVKNVIEYGSTR